MIAHDYSGLLDRHDVLDNPAKHITGLMAFHPKAIELVLDVDHRMNQQAASSKPVNTTAQRPRQPLRRSATAT